MQLQGTLPQGCDAARSLEVRSAELVESMKAQPKVLKVPWAACTSQPQAHIGMHYPSCSDTHDKNNHKQSSMYE